jgi:hypothetical protein
MRFDACPVVCHYSHKFAMDRADLAISMIAFASPAVNSSAL